MDTTAAKRTFSSFQLSAATLSAVEAKGYETPTPVQEETIPLALAGKDLVVQSRTGTGKTAAFGIPIVEKVDVDARAVQAVVLAPTRELALQVAAEVADRGRDGGVKVVSVYGGGSMEREVGGIRAGAHVVAGAPGRVLD